MPSQEQKCAFENCGDYDPQSITRVQHLTWAYSRNDGRRVLRYHVWDLVEWETNGRIRIQPRQACNGGRIPKSVIVFAMSQYGVFKFKTIKSRDYVQMNGVLWEVTSGMLYDPKSDAFIGATRRTPGTVTRRTKVKNIW